MTATTQAPPQHRETVGAFLLRRLREVGVRHVLGVAGDFNLELLEQLQATPGLEWAGCCNELNAAYAADGYARTHGVSALVTTYGVGELSALCGVAGAFAEHVPVVHVTGAPPLREIDRRGLLHHTAGDGDYENMMTCGRTFSVAQARLVPGNAVTEIDRCLRACLLEKKPVYLQLPSDVAFELVETPAGELSVDFRSDPAALGDFVRAATRVISAASSVAILVDADVTRAAQAQAVLALARKLDCPVAVMGTAKGAIDEHDPRYLGVYAGAYSAPHVREVMESAACRLELGVRLLDSTTGCFSQQLPPERALRIDATTARIGDEEFPGLLMKDVLAALLEAVAPRKATSPLPKPARPARLREVAPANVPLTQAWFWKRMADFTREGDVIVAENGTSLSGVAAMPLPSGAAVIAQALWGSIGYSLPATFGSLLAAPTRRHLLFIGDGSFQLTAQELSSIFRHGLKPAIFLLNNDGYTIERLILGESSAYNDIQPWKYASLGEVFANGVPYQGRRVSTPAELEDALQVAERGTACTFVEVMLGRLDAPPALRTLGPVYARQDYGRRALARITR